MKRREMLKALIVAPLAALLGRRGTLYGPRPSTTGGPPTQAVPSTATEVPYTATDVINSFKADHEFYAASDGHSDYMQEQNRALLRFLDEQYRRQGIV